MAKITYIPGEIANAAIDEHGNRKPVTRAHNIFDDNKNKNQAEINIDIDNSLNQLNNKINAVNKQDIILVDILPDVATADSKKIYRVVSENSYTDYMVNISGNNWKKLATYSFPGIDDEPTAGSNNIVKSGGVANKLAELDRKIGFIELPITSSNRYIATNFAEGTVIDIHNPTASGDYRYILAECEEGDLLKITGEGGNSPRLWAFIDSDYRIVSVDKVANHVVVNLLLEAPKNAKYIIINNKVKDGDNSPSFIAKKDSLYVTKAEKEVVDNLLSSYNENVGVLLKNKTINITAGKSNTILNTISMDVDSVTLVIKELVEYESIVITGAVIQKDGTVRYPAKRVYNNSTYQFELGSNVESFSLYIASSGATNDGSITLDVLIGLSKELKDLDEKIDNVSADLLKTINDNISRIDKTDSAYVLFSNSTISQADFAENTIIKLTANTKLTENIILPNNVKIDFNGHYISLSGYTIEGNLANEYISPENFNIPSTINPSSTVLSKFLELNICNFKFFNDITLNKSIIEIKTYKDIDFNNITINYTNTAPASYNTGVIRVSPVEYKTHQKIKNLNLNANYLYDYGFVYCYGARQLILENIKVKNVLKRAFVFGMTPPTGGYRGNIIAYNLDCWNDVIEGTPSDTIGYYINVGDSIFYNCVSAYFGVGFSIHSITTLINPHPWGSPYDGENNQPYFDIIWSKKLDMVGPQIDGRRYPIRFSVTDNHSRPYMKISNGIWYDNSDTNKGLEHKLISVDGEHSLIEYSLANVSMFTMIDGIKICDEDLSQYVKADIDYSPETN